MAHAQMGTGWENAEYRTYEFSNPEDDSTTLKETMQSRQRRSGTEKPLTQTEQMQLRHSTEKEWERIFGKHSAT